MLPHLIAALITLLIAVSAVAAYRGRVQSNQELQPWQRVARWYRAWLDKPEKQKRIHRIGIDDEVDRRVREWVWSQPGCVPIAGLYPGGEFNLSDGRVIRVVRGLLLPCWCVCIGRGDSPIERHYECYYFDQLQSVMLCARMELNGATP